MMASGPVHELPPAEGSGAVPQLPRVGNTGTYLPLISVPGHWSSALRTVLGLSTSSGDSSVLGAGRGLPSQGRGTRTWGRPLPAGGQLHMRVHFQQTNLAHLSRAFSEGKRNFIPLAICYEHKTNLEGAHQAKSFCPQDGWRKLQRREAPPAILLSEGT